MSDPDRKVLQLSAVVVDGTTDALATAFVLRCETPMSAQQAWDILAGGFAALFHNVLHEHLEEEEFCEQSCERIVKAVEAGRAMKKEDVRQLQ